MQDSYTSEPIIIVSWEITRAVPGRLGTWQRKSQLGWWWRWHFPYKPCLAKMRPLGWATASTVKMTFPLFWNGRKRTICMGERNGTVVSKQTLKDSLNGILGLSYWALPCKVLKRARTNLEFLVPWCVKQWVQEMEVYGKQGTQPGLST